MGELDKAEDIMILGLVILIGYGLYKFSESFSTTINGLFGLGSDTNAATAPAGYGGTYINAANQTVSHPLDTLETIIGLNQTRTPPPLVGSTTTDANGNVGVDLGVIQ